jgi:hypothetical protein
MMSEAILGRGKKVHRMTAERAEIVASKLSSWRTAARRKADPDTGPNTTFP